jgi:hypothetical protein
MNQPAQAASQMSDTEIVASVNGEVCAACSQAKSARSAFCRTDFAALTIWTRNQLAVGYEHPDYAGVFRAALRHLQLHTERSRRIPERGGWRHATSSDLVAAGYRFIRHAECNVPKCGAKIVWYRTPNGHVCSVNLSDCQPHRSSCADPNYRRPQTSARKGSR